VTGLQTCALPISVFSSHTLNDGDLVVLNMISSSGCVINPNVSSSSLLVNVNPSVSASIVITVNQDTLCSGVSPQFFAVLQNEGTSPLVDWFIDGVLNAANQGVNLATGFVPNTVLRLMGKPSIGRMMTSGKSDAQLLRDDFRGKLKETGVADEDYNITLASGEKYNIGKDGKSKLTNVDGKTTRRTWDVDWENPLAKYAVDKIDPRVRSVYTEEAAKAGVPVEQYTGMLVNAATSNAKNEKDVDANINAFLGKSGLDKGSGATISARPPAPNAPTMGPITKPTTIPEQLKNKPSFWDMLNSKMG
jgi:hypothetical protein